MEAEYEACEGFLFKLKENKKEWKKLYVKLSGAEIIYYDSPHGARADKRLKDGVKQVITAYPFDEFDGVNAPTSTPSYLRIETTHAKKVWNLRWLAWRSKLPAPSSCHLPQNAPDHKCCCCCYCLGPA